MSRTLLAAAMAMQGADVAPTAGQVAVCEQGRAQFTAVMAQWARLKAQAPR